MVVISDVATEKLLVSGQLHSGSQSKGKHKQMKPHNEIGTWEKDGMGEWVGGRGRGEC